MTIETAEMDTEQAAGPAPLLPDDGGDWPPATVLCSEGKHDVMPGEVCRVCHGECFTVCASGCSKPGDPDCKGRP